MDNTAPVALSCAGGPVGTADPTQLLAAMRRNIAGVWIITTKTGNGRYGMTATSVTSLSAEPPTLIMCVNKNSSLLQPLLDSGVFAAHLLAGHQQDVGLRFAQKPEGEARFATGEWSNDDAPPQLEGAAANFSGRIVEVLSYGTHALLLGAVDTIVLGDKPDILAYKAGQFQSF